MARKKQLDRSAGPLTVALLTEHLRYFGLAEGQIVLVQPHQPHRQRIGFNLLRRSQL